MDHSKARNEFGLDENNALDVQKERAKSTMPWVLGVVALLAVVALVMFAFTSTTSQNASNVPPASTTSGFGQK